MVTITVGTAEIGNFYLQRTHIANIAHSVAMAIQQNPNITAQKLYEFQKTLGGVLTPFTEVRKSDGSLYTGTTPCSLRDCEVDGLKVKILSGTAPVARSAVVQATESDWSNPRIGKLSGESNRNSRWPRSNTPWEIYPAQDTADDGKRYFVGVAVDWTAAPMFSLLRFSPMFGPAGVKQFAGAVVKPAIRRICPQGQMIKGISATGSPVCAAINQPDPYRGSFIRAVRPPEFNSTEGRTWNDWNELLEREFTIRTDWLPITREFWRNTCKSVNGAIPASASSDPVSFEYCGRYACSQYTGGHYPFMARMLEKCSEGGGSDCNGGRFQLSWACLYDYDY